MSHNCYIEHCNKNFIAPGHEIFGVTTAEEVLASDRDSIGVPPMSLPQHRSRTDVVGGRAKARPGGQALGARFRGDGLRRGD